DFNNISNIMTTPVMNDNQNSVNNGLRYQNKGYIHNNVIHPERQSDFNNMPSYTSTNENIRYNVMETQANSMTDIQNNCLHHQNGVDDTQQVDFNNFPQRQIPERETRPNYNRNASLLQNNVITNGVLPTDTNLDNQNNYTRNDYPQQQADFNNLPQHQILERDQNINNTNSINSNNNIVTTQARY